MTSPPYAAPHTGLYFACLLALHAGSGCGDDNGLGDNPDGSFGTGAGNYPRDAGMDGAVRDMDAGSQGVGPTVNVRFLHAIPNTGALLLCHDPDGPGPIAPTTLGAQLRAEFGSRSATLRVPALRGGVLSLQRTAALDAGVDGGTGDGGVEDPCAAATREATIPLPITGAWLSPTEPFDEQDFAALDLLRTFATDAPAITLLGTGVALNASALDRRAAAARAAAQAQGEQAAAAAEAQERALLAAAFEPRTLIQPDPRTDQSDTFNLSVLHAVADVPPRKGVPANTAVGALRVCMTAGTADQGALPRAPAAGIPFRVRTQLGDFNPRQSYEFRAYAADDFDDGDQGCATTSLSPIAQTTYDDFAGGHVYTLAVVGAIAPNVLCSAERTSLVRPSCSPYPSQLGARIEVLED
ncbi:MAG TPA: hypothetical protein VFX59_18600 [Polyangiales bacterium]|nr:hypothetical protein [Polyangiales bacterium]